MEPLSEASSSESSRRLHVSKKHPSAAERPMTSQRALGIDFGERRIGLALSDPEGRLALPFGTIERDTDRRAVYHIAAIARREGVGRLVLGEPLGLDGSVGEAAQRVHAFGRKLKKATGLPLLWVNEALTTVEATARLREVGADRRDSPERRDAVAAQILLQEALECHLKGRGGEIDGEHADA